MIRPWPCWMHASRAFKARWFTATARRHEIRSIDELPSRLQPAYSETTQHDLLALKWPSPPRNILFVRKDEDPQVHNALIEYANHVKSSYPESNLIFEPYVASDIHGHFDFPIHTITGNGSNVRYHAKVDLTSTLGGDGTILHAASLFATAHNVPPVLSFSMGTLGFLGEWKFKDYKRAFREVYVSGHPGPLPSPDTETVTDGGSGPHSTDSSTSSWSSVRGKSLGSTRGSRILMRNRLKIGLYDPFGRRLPHEPPFTHPSDSNNDQDIFALNEVLLHRGALPHLAHITILIGDPPHRRPLTTAIADGFLVSTPTGSTAYSLSSGGCIVHPLVSSLLLTPICPRSLSFRPVVLPANTTVTLRIDELNRGKEIEVSVDGVRRQQGLRSGMEVRVVGEEALRTRRADVVGSRDWFGGGVPSIVRTTGRDATAGGSEDHWVGGLNGLLKFNYPFGEDG